VHRTLHPGCAIPDCDLSVALHSALERVDAARILEWEHEERGRPLTLRLHLRRAHERARTWATLTVTDITDARQLTGTLQAANEALSGLMRRTAAERPLLIAGIDRKLRDLSGQLIIAQEIERRRIAAELHDGLGQWLSMTKLSLETGLRKIGNAPGADDVLRAVSHVEHTIREVRSIAQKLRPSVLEEVGLVATLELLCHELQLERPHLMMHCEFSGDAGSVSQDQGIAMVRILQESLNNIAKHSGATDVRVEGHFSRDRTSLSVRDNGTGFTRELIVGGSGGGIGIASMRERAEQTGGRFRITSKRGVGTTITVSWMPTSLPLSPAAIVKAPRSRSQLHKR
jgi:signal transduction histidine kinase